MAFTGNYSHKETIPRILFQSITRKPVVSVTVKVGSRFASESAHCNVQSTIHNPLDDDKLIVNPGALLQTGACRRLTARPPKGGG
jgi:hypothetical protein